MEEESTYLFRLPDTLKRLSRDRLMTSSSNGSSLRSRLWSNPQAGGEVKVTGNG